ncbi:hypothetical protein DM02DRAFT_188340 [Periconia macrospinosa]|uniref:Uncharacterized protein n=1 Tax=Periconia macrospinosa TaxID=97972 RepID=A0A2V1D913_9PLEO|nr:hypothetical protein DM02DRAFT_188340 [Periconia macrospinosa]
MSSSTALPTITLLPPPRLSISPPPFHNRIYIIPPAICGSLVIAVAIAVFLLHRRKNKPVIAPENEGDGRQQMQNAAENMVLRPNPNVPKILIHRPHNVGSDSGAWETPRNPPLPPLPPHHISNIQPPNPTQNSNFLTVPRELRRVPVPTLTNPSYAGPSRPSTVQQQIQPRNPIPLRPESPLTTMHRIKESQQKYEEQRAKEAERTKHLHERLDWSDQAQGGVKGVSKDQKGDEINRESFVSDSFTVWSEVEDEHGVRRRERGRSDLTRSVLPLPDRYRGSEVSFEKLKSIHGRLEGDEY